MQAFAPKADVMIATGPDQELCEQWNDTRPVKSCTGSGTGLVVTVPVSSCRPVCGWRLRIDWQPRVVVALAPPRPGLV